MFDLVYIKLAKVGHIEFAFFGIDDSCKPVELDLFVI